MHKSVVAASELFDFEYTWVIYKPGAKRKYGPYTMPVLYGDRLVGRVDAKLDRENANLIINGAWYEDWFTPDGSYRVEYERALRGPALFVGATRVSEP